MKSCKIGTSSFWKSLEVKVEEAKRCVGMKQHGGRRPPLQGVFVVAALCERRKGGVI